MNSILRILCSNVKILYLEVQTHYINVNKRIISTNQQICFYMSYKAVQSSFLIVLTHGISNIFNFPCQLRMIVHIQGEDERPETDFEIE